MPSNFTEEGDTARILKINLSGFADTYDSSPDVTVAASLNTDTYSEPFSHVLCTNISNPEDTSVYIPKLYAFFARGIAFELNISTGVQNRFDLPPLIISPEALEHHPNSGVLISSVIGVLQLGMVDYENYSVDNIYVFIKYNNTNEGQVDDTERVGAIQINGATTHTFLEFLNCPSDMDKIIWSADTAKDVVQTETYYWRIYDAKGDTYILILVPGENKILEVKKVTSNSVSDLNREKSITQLIPSGSRLLLGSSVGTDVYLNNGEMYGNEYTDTFTQIISYPNISGLSDQTLRTCYIFKDRLSVLNSENDKHVQFAYLPVDEGTPWIKIRIPDNYQVISVIPGDDEVLFIVKHDVEILYGILNSSSSAIRYYNNPLSIIADEINSASPLVMGYYFNEKYYLVFHNAASSQLRTIEFNIQSNEPSIREHNVSVIPSLSNVTVFASNPGKLLKYNLPDDDTSGIICALTSLSSPSVFLSIDQDLFFEVPMGATVASTVDVATDGKDTLAVLYLNTDQSGGIAIYKLKKNNDGDIYLDIANVTQIPTLPGTLFGIADGIFAKLIYLENNQEWVLFNVSMSAAENMTIVVANNILDMSKIPYVTHIKLTGTNNIPTLELVQNINFCNKEDAFVFAMPDRGLWTIPPMPYSDAIHRLIQRDEELSAQRDGELAPILSQLDTISEENDTQGTQLTNVLNQLPDLWTEVNSAESYISATRATITYQKSNGEWAEEPLSMRNLINAIHYLAKMVLSINDTVGDVVYIVNNPNSQHVAGWDTYNLARYLRDFKRAMYWSGTTKSIFNGALRPSDIVDVPLPGSTPWSSSEY